MAAGMGQGSEIGIPKLKTRIASILLAQQAWSFMDA
jgi:hypothetical protein